MIYKKWAIASPDKALCIALSRELNITAVTAQLLVNRGLRTPSEAKKFMEPSISDIADPSLFEAMPQALSRLRIAWKNNEKILIHGDYDADGITGTAILKSIFDHLGKEVSVHIPMRADGYGMSEATIRKASKDGVDLIITVDCGITNIHEVALAKKLGMDVIITDHHDPLPELPQAVAIINPKLKDSTYPSKQISGSIVAFKMAWAIAQDFCSARKLPSVFEDFLNQGISLAALGTVADVVPLLEENRLIAKLGIELMPKSANPGLKRLLEKLHLTDGLDSGKIAWQLAPRVNAVGRMHSAMDCLELFLTPDLQKIEQIIKHMEDSNKLRQEVGEKMEKEARKLIDADPSSHSSNAVVVWNEGWHPGVIGIVAGRISDKTRKPAIIISVKDGRGRASIRSNRKSFNVSMMVESISDLVLNGGGHSGAGGFSAEESNLPEIKRRITEFAAALPAEEDVSDALAIDAELLLSSINYSLVRESNLLQPFGTGNHTPIFASSNLRIVKGPEAYNKNTMMVMFSQHSTVTKAIAFYLHDRLAEYVQQNIDRPCSAAYELMVGRTGGIDLKLLDIEFER